VLKAPAPVMADQKERQKKDVLKHNGGRGEPENCIPYARKSSSSSKRGDQSSYLLSRERKTLEVGGKKRKGFLCKRKPAAYKEGKNDFILPLWIGKAFRGSLSGPKHQMRVLLVRRIPKPYLSIKGIQVN